MDGRTDMLDEQVVLPPIDIQRIQIPIRQLSPLIMHAWSQKAIQMMLDKQTKRAAQAREAKDPEKDYLESMYRLPDETYGFPATAFKNAMVRAGTYTDSKMTFLRGAFYVTGDDEADKLVRVNGTPRPREDMVRVGQGTADIRYRAEFPEWEAVLRVQYNARAISAEQIVNLVSVAGFSVGIGDWRPEKDGSYGRFEVKTQPETGARGA
jgi:hypothetical protein